MEEPIKVPAIGFSITANIDGNRQTVFQGFFDENEDDKTVNKRIDRVMRLVDRQRSIYEIPGLKEELLKLTDELAQYNEDVDKAEGEFQKAQATLDVQVVEVQQTRAKEEEAGRADHARSGKLGSYKPGGNRARNLELCQKQIEDIKKQKETNAAERQQFLDNIKISIERRQARIEILKVKIADLEQALGD
jgi:chromosome segregation ATPase